MLEEKTTKKEDRKIDRLFIAELYEKFEGWDDVIMDHLNDNEVPVSLEGRMLYHCWIAIKKDLGKD